MKATSIYALCEPGTRIVRYIGKSNNLKRRFRQHLKSREKNHLGNWLRSLYLPPVLVILHEVGAAESWAEEERRYISCARAIGMDLVNTTEGGEGASCSKSPECRAAISVALKGVPRGPYSPEHCAAISAALKGVPRGSLSPEHCAAISVSMTGVPKSPGARAAMSAAKTGVPQGPLSPEHRAAISAAKTGVPQGPRSSETRAAMSAAKTGVPHSPERRAAQSAAKKGVPWSPARRAAYERTNPKI